MTDAASVASGEGITGSRRKRKDPKRQRLKQIVLYALFLVMVAVAAMLLCVFVFFKVHKVEVSGNTKYADLDILAIAGIKEGDNLVMLESEIVEERLLRSFPYMESVSVKKQLPVSVEIIIEEAEASYSVIYSEGMYAYISSSRKLLEAQEKPADGSIVVKGGDVRDVDGVLVFSDDKVMNTFDIIALAIDKCFDSGITEINITNIYDISIIYDNRVKLEVGGVSGIEGKLDMAREICTGGGVGKGEYGILDLSLYENTKKAYFDALSDTTGFDADDEHASFEEYMAQIEAEEKAELEAAKGEGEDSPVDNRGDDIPDAPYASESSEGDSPAEPPKEYGTDEGRGDDIPDV